MEIKILTGNGQQGGVLGLADSAFGVEYNEALVHQVVVAYMAAGRAGTKMQKNRSEVRGGGSKPWRQKGLGRARAGSIRSPIWRGGGVTFAARPRSFKQKVNRKMYRGAMRSILSELLRKNRLLVVDDLSLEKPKTKEMAARLSGLGVSDVLVVTAQRDDTLALACRNLPRVDVQCSAGIDPVSLLAFKTILMTAAAVKMLEERFA